MPELNPPEQQLGLSSPALGPWFDDDLLSLPASEPNLSVRVPGSFAALALGSTGAVFAKSWAPARAALVLGISIPFGELPLLIVWQSYEVDIFLLFGLMNLGQTATMLLSLFVVRRAGYRLAPITPIR